MRTSFLLLLVIGAVAVAAAVTQPVAIPATPTEKVGGLKPLNDVDDPRIQRLREWTAEEHDAKRADDGLVFGGFKPISNIEDPKIQGLGEWAVAEHAKRANGGLRFGKVVSGEEQVVSGVNYLLLIEALTGDGENVTYRALVYDSFMECCWADTRVLVAIIPANSAKLVKLAGSG